MGILVVKWQCCYRNDGMAVWVYYCRNGSVGIGVQEQVNYIGHDLDYTSPLPENNDLLHSNSSLKPKISTSRVKVDFECDQCANIFSSKALLTKHSHQVHWRNYGYSTFPDKLVICSANKVNLTDIINQEKFTCILQETCLEAFLSKELLDKHRKTVHVEGQKESEKLLNSHFNYIYLFKDLVKFNLD